eukprot:gene10031-3133_t
MASDTSDKVGEPEPVWCPDIVCSTVDFASNVTVRPNYTLLNPRAQIFPEETDRCPMGRYGCSMVRMGRCVYLVGGTNVTNYYNDVWRFNPRSEVWEELKSKNTNMRDFRRVPAPSFGFALAVLEEEDCILMSGGYDNRNMSNDTFKFDARTCEWTNTNYY